jgi:phosphoenolpyruvate phosphomutase
VIDPGPFATILRYVIVGEDSVRSKNKAFRDLLSTENTNFICEGHNGLSAKIVEEAGFPGIWASGLSISAQYGLRDNNEASWSQVLDAVEFMADACTIPILVDGDTGFGNFNNFRKFVRKLEQVGVSGVCIEDKLFPKKNSFIDGHKQELADIEEFCGKIRAGKDFQTDSDFSIVARVEAFIAGWGVEEAIRRAEAYSDAGADAVLIHSSQKDASEIFEFMKVWDKRCPVVIVPTTYYKTDTKEFEKRNVSLVIWANHMIRSSVKAMQSSSKKIFELKTLVGLETDFVPVSEIFRLQNNKELELAEAKYLPEKRLAEAFLLSGGGKDIRQLISQGFLSVDKYLSNFKKNGINRIHLIVEGNSSVIDSSFDSVTLLSQQSKSELDTLAHVFEKIVSSEGDVVIAYADTIFESQNLLGANEFDSFDAMAIGSYIDKSVVQKKENQDVIRVFDSYDSEMFSRFLISSIENKFDFEDFEFIWSGLLIIPQKSKNIVVEILKQKIENKEIEKMNLPDLVNSMINKDLRVGLRVTFNRWIEFGDKLFKVSS